MRITFDNTPSSNVDRVTTGYRTAASGRGRTTGGYALDISGTVTDNTAYGLQDNYGGRNVHGRTAEEVMQAAGNEDITLYRNYMAVMSNSMSDEDFARMLKEGYNPMDMDIETAVTIVDTIKAELIKGGVDIAGYTDNLDMDTLAQITGSPAFAEQLVKAFAAEDIPATEENVAQAMEAFERGMELTEMSEGTVKYMVTNEKAPDIDSLYMAQHAGAACADRQGRGYFMDEMPGYYAKKAADTDVSKLQEQMGKVIEKAGFPVTEETLSDAGWLIEKGIPLTEKNIQLLEELKTVALPAAEEDLFEAIAGSIAEGKTAGEANLVDRKSVYRKAADCIAAYDKRYQEMLSAEPTAENIRARRQLEEIRLHMTAEANVKLINSGFSIDTAPMEEMINALKALEEEQAGTVGQMETPAAVCKETLAKTREIPYLPAAALGRLLSQGQELTVDSVYETGKSMEEALRQAKTAYDTMMTVPRADMGDSIKTAFRNVDVLLESMGLELTNENRKALRSLSYNQMELTEENLLAVKGADKMVQRVVEKMTPAAVLDMIRDGINPLKTSMEELESYFAGRDNYAQESEKYSRFLYNLEQNKEITAEEKESYIGVYRLLRQIEKSDGAAIGKLVDTQARINFENLLSAVRTGKLKGIDVSVNEDFGSLEEAVQKGVSIDTQIEAAYGRTLLEQVRSSGTGEEAMRLLMQLNQPVTMDNLLAAEAIGRDGAAPFKRQAEIRQKTAGSTAKKEALSKDALFNSTIELFHEETEDIFAGRESLQEVYGKFIEQAEGHMRAMTYEEGMTSIDVRQMQLVCKQLHIQGLRAREVEEYDLPQIMDGELTAVHLKLVHNSQEKGRVFVGMDTVRCGYVSGEFTMEEGTVSGFFTGVGEEAMGILEKAVSRFSVKLEKTGLTPGKIQAIEGSLQKKADISGGSREETKELYRVAGMVIQALREEVIQYEN